jgi:UDP-N-acetylglucosamine 4,6-dehydratase
LGQAVVRHALAAGARRVVVYARDEEKHRRMRDALGDDRVAYCIGDVRDAARLLSAMRGPLSVDTVVHAAALKHVDWCERHPDEAIKTNVLGSMHVIDAALMAGVSRVLAISSDKACVPFCLYGATKLAMERLVVAKNPHAGPRLSCVRYGNILGSSGSVVQIWREQAAKGQPLTVTDPEMTRFFSRLPEVVRFVSEALTHMEGGEVFVPKLRASRIGEVARALTDQPLAVVGLRPGEKRHESLVSVEEGPYTRDLGWAYAVYPPGYRALARGTALTGMDALHSATAAPLPVEELLSWLPPGVGA